MIRTLNLLDRLEDGQDDDAWHQLIDIYVPVIRGWLRLLHVPAQEAEDVAQEVLAAVVRELPRFQHHQRPSAFRAWLRAITINRVREWWRGRDRIAHASSLALDQLEDPHSDLSRHCDEEHDANVVGQLLDRVRNECAPRLWRAFSRHVLDGEPVANVAAELQTTANAILISKCRVLRKLRQHAQEFVTDP